MVYKIRIYGFWCCTLFPHIRTTSSCYQFCRFQVPMNTKTSFVECRLSVCLYVCTCVCAYVGACARVCMYVYMVGWMDGWLCVSLARERLDNYNSVAWVLKRELYRPSDRRLSAKLVPTLTDRGCRVVSATNPPQWTGGCILLLYPISKSLSAMVGTCCIWTEALQMGPKT
jgi:hypothetical protein